MSFVIKLQTNNSDKVQLTKNLTDIVSLTGTLKDETSIIDPVILVNATMSQVKTCNYMTISEFGRSYFVTGIRVIRDGLMEITGHVDVLSTYASQIRANDAIIKKQESQWNLYLNDGSFKVYQNNLIMTRDFPSGFNESDDWEFVLAVAGG